VRAEEEGRLLALISPRVAKVVMPQRIAASNDRHWGS
jgi:hypothetical protein